MPLPWKRNLPTESSPDEALRSRTEKIAYELYQNRQSPNRSGNAHTDWEIAEKIVRNPVRKALYCCHRPFIRLEKNTWEPLLAWANNQALLSLLSLVSNIGLIIAVTTYIASEKHRRNAEVLNAWQTITNAHGQAGSGGRMQSLEFLNASPGANWRRKFPWVCAPSPLCLWPAESLDGIDLAVESSDNVIENRQSELPENSLLGEIGRGVYLRAIRLTKASLSHANLAGADLSHANLEGASLSHANLENVNLNGANLESAYLWHANLNGAYLWTANLKGANLRSANLKSANLVSVNLEGANLLFANLEGANLASANLKEASGLTQRQLSQAKLCYTQLPEDIGFLANRNCDELD